MCSCMSCHSLTLILEGSLSSSFLLNIGSSCMSCHVMVFSFILRIGFQENQNDDPFMDYLQSSLKIIKNNEIPVCWFCLSGWVFPCFTSSSSSSLWKGIDCYEQIIY